MRILDRYIIRQFVQTLLFGLLTFTIIFIIIDMMEKLDDFLDHNVETMVIVQYYVAFAPEIIKLMTPVAVLLASLFVTGKLSNNNELTAMKSSGMSLYRFMIPLLLLSFAISLGAVYFNGWIVPYANQKKFGIERVFLERNPESLARTYIYLQDGPYRIVSIAYFDGASRMGNRISIQEFSDTNLVSLTRRYDAARVSWDSVAGKWILADATIREFGSRYDRVEHLTSVTMDGLSFKPADIVKKIEKPDEMNYFELKDFIDRQKSRGNDVARWAVDFHGKIAFPFSSFIVVLFGVPFSFGKRRKGLAIQFGISVAICFIYLVFMKVSQVFGYNGDIDPILTAWLANFIFLGAGIVNIVSCGK
ncbi:MAG: LPS export ABC transporter permease LptG [Ignavibacteriales bacterium]|nr:LPS export ABC transporter permease LptG [Ignavibacteriales bacterium]